MWCRGVGHSDESDDDEGRVCGWLWGLRFDVCEKGLELGR